MAQNGHGVTRERLEHSLALNCAWSAVRMTAKTSGSKLASTENNSGGKRQRQEQEINRGRRLRNRLAGRNSREFQRRRPHLRELLITAGKRFHAALTPFGLIYYSPKFARVKFNTYSPHLVVASLSAQRDSLN